MKWTDALMREALNRRWQPDGHLVIHEAPMNADRSGKRIDMLVIGLWSSRGHEVEAVEIKVSVGDWRRELANPAKADFWVRHSDLFWVAAPADVATKIKDEIPSGWGLISVTEKQNRVLVKPTKNRDKLPLPWTTTIGMLRAGAGAGANAIHQARLAGQRTGREEGLAEAKRKGLGDVSDTELFELRQAARERDRLAGMVAAYQEHSGLDLSDQNRWGVKDIGFLSGLAQQADHSPAMLAKTIPNQIRRMVEDLERLDKMVKSLEGGGTTNN